MGALCCCCYSRTKKSNKNALREKLIASEETFFYDNQTYSAPVVNVEPIPSKEIESAVEISPMAISPPINAYTAWISSDGCYSLLKMPPTEQLLAQGKAWVRKRGHMVRTWKTRYFVLQHAQLRYYEAEDPLPPYGKGLKGEMKLNGAVVIATDPFKPVQTDRRNIFGGHLMHKANAEEPAVIAQQLEICGPLGQKDLFLELDYTEDAQRWARTLNWCIRKATVADIMSSISGSSSKGKQSLSLQSEQTGGHPFDDWLANERKACRSAISLLSEPRVIRILRFRRDGCLSVRECSFQVLFPPSSSSSSTSAGQMDEGLGFGSEFGLSDGREIFLAYDLLPEGDLGKTVLGKGLTDHCKKISLADIEDITVHKSLLDQESLLRAQTNLLRHKYCASAPTTNVISIRSKYGHAPLLNVEACCLRDYGGAFLAIQSLLLFINLQKTTSQAAEAARGQTAGIDAYRKMPAYIACRDGLEKETPF